MIVKLQTKHHLEFLSLKGGCRGSSESTHLLEISCTGSYFFMCQSYLICESCEVFQLTNEGHLQTKLQPLKKEIMTY